MRKYAAEDERIIRAKRLADEWKRSTLITPMQHERIVAGLRVDLRRTNQFLHLTLFAFGLLIVASAVGLVVVTLGVSNATPFGTVCLVSAAVCAAFAELLTGRFRVYRFGIEEACAVSAAVLVACGTALIAGQMFNGLSGNRVFFVALVTGSAAAFAIYRRFGYVYAGLAAMLCAGLAPFSLDMSPAAHRLPAAAILSACFIAARTKRRRYGNEFPGDEHGVLQASAWLAIYVALNLHASFTPFIRPVAPFYWFTYAMTWILPAAGAWLSIRDRDRPLLDASMVMAMATLVTNKPYLGLERKPWDPILFGLLLIGGAIVVRRWLASGEGGSRNGFTATRILRSDRDRLAAVGIASAAFHPAPTHTHADPPAPDPFDGGRSGGAGGGASF
jgi:hypothetical protein